MACRRQPARTINGVESAAREGLRGSRGLARRAPAAASERARATSPDARRRPTFNLARTEPAAAVSAGNQCSKQIEGHEFTINAKYDWDVKVTLM